MTDKSELMKSIVNMVDTGACEDSIVKDVLEWGKFQEQDIRDQIHVMLNDGVLADRGNYLVFLWRDEHANEYVYGKKK